MLAFAFVVLSAPSAVAAFESAPFGVGSTTALFVRRGAAAAAAGAGGTFCRRGDGGSGRALSMDSAAEVADLALMTSFEVVAALTTFAPASSSVFKSDSESESISSSESAPLTLAAAAAASSAALEDEITCFGRVSDSTPKASVARLEMSNAARKSTKRPHTTNAYLVYEGKIQEKGENVFNETTKVATRLDGFLLFLYNLQIKITERRGRSERTGR